MRPWAVAAFALALTAPITVGFVHAQALPPDADKDGVADDVDLCPDSPPYELVGDDGCSVCPCGGDVLGSIWASRTDYLHCVLDEVHARRADGRITRKAARPFVKAARNATCGQAMKVRCCIMFEGKSEGMCRVVDEASCDSALSIGGITSLAAGSCFPNPCVAE
jgi:hypothetical protein